MTAIAAGLDTDAVLVDDDDVVGWLGTMVPEGTHLCLGFDGSSSDDWTFIRAETFGGYAFTPGFMVGEDEQRPTFWNPATCVGGRIPHSEVNAAVSALFGRYNVRRMYCDPRDWTTDIENWSLEYGEDRVIVWDTGHGTARIPAMHASLERFVNDLVQGRITHDGCPVVKTHMLNARKVARPGERYILGKPAQHQKIDGAMATVLAHEAASDARAGGWAKDLEPATIMVWR